VGGQFCVASGFGLVPYHACYIYISAATKGLSSTFVRFMSLAMLCSLFPVALPTNAFEVLAGTFLVCIKYFPAVSALQCQFILRSSRVVASVATVLVSIPASSDTVESEGRQLKQC
jgi:hypothetical protein